MLLRLFEAEKPTLTAVCQEHGLTPPQAYLLRRLQPDAPTAMSALASALGCDASNITGLVDRLEARGFIERRTDRQDRRVKMIAVTRAGAQFRQQLLERMLQPPSSLAALTETQKRTLRDILRQVVQAAEGAPRVAS